VNGFVAAHSQDSRAQDLVRLRVDHYFMKPLVSPFLDSAAHTRHRPLADERRPADFRTSASVMPALPSGGSM
jgi:hypothetical protein